MNDHEPVAAIGLDLWPFVRRDGVLNCEGMELELFRAQREVARPGVNHVEPHERIVFLEYLTEIGQVRGWLRDAAMAQHQAAQELPIARLPELSGGAGHRCRLTHAVGLDRSHGPPFRTLVVTLACGADLLHVERELPLARLCARPRR